MFDTWNKKNTAFINDRCLVLNPPQGCCLTIFQGAQKGERQKVRSPTSNVLGDASKT